MQIEWKMSFNLSKNRWHFDSNNYLRVESMRGSQKNPEKSIASSTKVWPHYVRLACYLTLRFVRVKDVKLSRQTVLYIKLSTIIKYLSFVADFHSIYLIIRQDMRTIHQNGLEVQYNCTQQKNEKKFKIIIGVAFVWG